MNSSEIRKERYLHDRITMKQTAKELGFKDVGTYRKKESGVHEFKTPELKNVVKFFDLSPARFNEIFFDGEIDSWKSCTG